MSPRELTDAIANFVAFERKKLDALNSFKLARFETFSFSTSLISTRTCDEWIAELAKKDTVRRPVLYYFKITEAVDPSIICEVVTRMKQSPGKSNRAFPRVNSKNIESCTNILYVGKTEKNFPKRFKEHLGFGSDKTFSLNLVHWRTEERFQLELHFACVDPDQLPTLEGIESAMHHVLKPLLGRAGK
jgi:hypothetical protein